MCVCGAGDSYRRDFGQQHVVSYAKGGLELADESSWRSVLWSNIAVWAPASSTANAEHSGNSFYSTGHISRQYFLSPSEDSSFGINTNYNWSLAK